MIRASITLTFKSGQKFSYANKNLVDKSGDDGEGNLKHKGRDCFFYAYTGCGDDTFDDQTGKGKCKGDYEFLKGQIGGSGLLKFPEDGDTTELVRKRDITDKPLDRFSIAASELVAVAVKEVWARYPETDNRESGYMLPKDSANFAGFRETEDIKDRGPDFDAFKTFDDGYIPKPIVEYDGSVITVKNQNEYDETVTTEDKDGIYVYGIKNGKKSGSTFIRTV